MNFLKTNASHANASHANAGQANLFVKRHPDYKRYRPLIGSIICVEGLIGAGKSTAAKSIVRYLEKIGLKAIFYNEYLNEDLLHQYLNDMDKYAYSFQLFMLGKRAEIYRNAAEKASEGFICVIDRSVAGDWAFAKMQKDAGKISGEDWKTYNSVMSAEQLIEPSFTVYLQCSPETAVSRTQKRNRRGEETYEISYFENLRESYMHSLGKIKHPLIMISWGEDQSLCDENLLSDNTCVFILERLREESIK